MKRLFCLFVTFCMLISLAAGVLADDTISTTHLPDGSLTFSIEGSTLTVSGAVLCENLEKIRLTAGMKSALFPPKTAAVSESASLCPVQIRSL